MNLDEIKKLMFAVDPGFKEPVPLLVSQAWFDKMKEMGHDFTGNPSFEVVKPPAVGISYKEQMRIAKTKRGRR